MLRVAYPTGLFKTSLSACHAERKMQIPSKINYGNHRGVLQFQAVLENELLCAKI